MRKVISDQDVRVMEVIARLRYVTVPQVAYWMEVSPRRAAGLMTGLLDKGLLARYEEQRPHVYRLSDRAGGYVESEYQYRWRSAHAIHQYLMRNQVEIDFRLRFELEGMSFRMVKPSALIPMGFNAAKGEHVATLTHQEGQGRLRAMVVIDDYRMKPSRVSHVLGRSHKTENNEAFLSKVRDTGRVIIPRYYRLVSEVFVVTTEESRVELFERYLTDRSGQVSVNGRSALEIGSGAERKALPWSVHYVPYIWRFA